MKERKPKIKPKVVEEKYLIGQTKLNWTALDPEENSEKSGGDDEGPGDGGIVCGHKGRGKWIRRNWGVKWVVKESKRRVEVNVLKPEGPPFIVSERKQRSSQTVTAFFFFFLFFFLYLILILICRLRLFGILEWKFDISFSSSSPHLLATVGNYYLYILHKLPPKLCNLFTNIKHLPIQQM